MGARRDGFLGRGQRRTLWKARFVAHPDDHLAAKLYHPGDQGRRCGRPSCQLGAGLQHGQELERLLRRSKAARGQAKDGKCRRERKTVGLAEASRPVWQLAGFGAGPCILQPRISGRSSLVYHTVHQQQLAWLHAPAASKALLERLVCDGLRAIQRQAQELRAATLWRSAANRAPRWPAPSVERRVLSFAAGATSGDRCPSWHVASSRRSARRGVERRFANRAPRSGKRWKQSEECPCEMRLEIWKPKC